MSTEAVVVMCTVADVALAERIAEALLEARAAACIHVGPLGTSIYRWQGRVEKSAEHKLLIKTTRSRLADAERIIATVHPYEVPELLVLSVEHGASSYLAWLEAETK